MNQFEIDVNKRVMEKLAGSVMNTLVEKGQELATRPISGRVSKAIGGAAGGGLTGGLIGGTIGAVAKPIKMFMDKRKHNANYNWLFDRPINYTAKDYIKGSFQGARKGGLIGGGIGATVGGVNGWMKSDPSGSSKAGKKLVNTLNSLKEKINNEEAALTKAKHNKGFQLFKEEMGSLIPGVSQANTPEELTSTGANMWFRDMPKYIYGNKANEFFEELFNKNVKPLYDQELQAIKAYGTSPYANMYHNLVEGLSENTPLRYFK